MPARAFKVYSLLLCAVCFPSQPVKKVVKKVVKKAVKKPVKKVVRKAPVRGKKGAPVRGAGRNAGNVRGKGKSIVEIAKFGGGAVSGYGGGNGEALFEPSTIAFVGLWVLILLRFVLFYGFFGGE